MPLPFLRDSVSGPRHMPRCTGSVGKSLAQSQPEPSEQIPMIPVVRTAEHDDLDEVIDVSAE